MDLKSILPGLDKKIPTEHFWGLIIEPGWVSASIWKIEQDSAQVVSSSPPSAWEFDEELVNAVDASLSSAIQDFPEDVKEPSKAVFGISTSWVDKGDIKDEYLSKIKRVCKELELAPLGFVVLPEAIAHFIKSEEGSPLSAVVIGVYKDNLEISLFKTGTLVGVTQVARSVSVAEDVTEGLSRFAGESNVFSRFLIYNGKEGELEQVRQDLLKVNWDDYPQLKFLHTPKVEIVDPTKKINAVSLAGAAEMAGIKKVEGLENREDVAPAPEEFPEPEEGPPAEELGFVVDKDVKEEKEVEYEAESEPVIHDEEFLQEGLENVEPVAADTFERKPKSKLPKLNTGMLVDKLKSSTKFLKGFGGVFSFFKAGKNTLLIGIIIFLILVLLGMFWWWYAPKAVVTMYVSPKRQEERITVSVDAKADGSNFDEKILKGDVVQTTVSGDRTKSTSGTKTVGDKAKGEITIYRAGSKLNLPSGTLIKGPGGLDFALDNDVEVASGSASLEGLGTTKAQVTAKDIGATHNLASGTSFTVSNYSTSEITAKNDSAFSGGSSREINAVSEDDQKTLKDELENELKENAQVELSNTLSDNQFLIADSLEYNSTSSSYSNKVGDEAESLKLSLTLKASAVVVDKKELLDLASQALKDKIPEKFVLRQEQIDVDFEYDSKSDSVYKFDVFINANLLPDIKTDEVAKRIRGKYPSLAKEYMTKEVPGFVRAEIKINPALPGRLNTLPKVAKNIDVEIAAEK